MQRRSVTFGFGSVGLLGLVLLLGGVGCRPRYAARAPVNAAPDACCKSGDAAMKQFSGCRMTDRCRLNEPIWLRGAVTCSPVERGRCSGGRCCHLEPEVAVPVAAPAPPMPS